MNKTFLLAVLFLIIGFGSGAFVYKNKQNPIPQSNTQVNSNQVYENKLFELLNKFKTYPGHIRVDQTNESLGLMVVQHPVDVIPGGNMGGNDAPATFSVYDYINDKIYQNIGEFGLGGGEYPEAILNEHQILVLVSNDTPENKLIVVDFKDKTFKDLPIKLTEKNTIESDIAENGSLNIWIRGGTTIDGSYTLDTKTLELKKMFQ